MPIVTFWGKTSKNSYPPMLFYKRLHLVFHITLEISNKTSRVAASTNGAYCLMPGAVAPEVWAKLKDLLPSSPGIVPTSESDTSFPILGNTYRKSAQINLGNNYRTDCQSERQTQDLHEVVLASSRQILECVNNMIHIKYPVSRALAQFITNHY